ncbi:hypothetical protein ASU31_07805 [Pedobacter ginsenosidimutans]|jgi:hypothetical protein|uniref:Uncharacterized protein n=1 Tax=Pedobacter ginsenosidimutans TaxID=687842 RepID=A0A0T5VS88_9SPHI|nr:DUF2683 family protein [Pedobacter ginsenosidimutans]KRT16710.1 hypothetical protein ASU31_07805 [Pedobacter ginsenosidimutans]
METYLVHPDKMQEKALKAFLKALEVPYEIKKDSSLPAHVVSGIKKGQDDIKAGKSFSLEEFKEKISTI